MTAVDMLRLISRNAPTSPVRWPGGWLLDNQSGSPSDATTPYFFSYYDETNDRLYVNVDFGVWEEIASAESLAPILTAT